MHELGPLLAELSLEATCLRALGQDLPTAADKKTVPLSLGVGSEEWSSGTEWGLEGEERRGLHSVAGKGRGGVDGGGGVMGEMMRRVLSLRKEELPRECCLQANSVRVALALLLRPLLLRSV